MTEPKSQVQQAADRLKKHVKECVFCSAGLDFARARKDRRDLIASDGRIIFCETGRDILLELFD